MRSRHSKPLFLCETAARRFYTTWKCEYTEACGPNVAISTDFYDAKNSLLLEFLDATGKVTEEGSVEITAELKRKTIDVSGEVSIKIKKPGAFRMRIRSEGKIIGESYPLTIEKLGEAGKK